MASSIASSSASAILVPRSEKNLMPLSATGLWEAEITAPAVADRSRVRNATAGVGTMPARTTSTPAEQSPATRAPSSIGPGDPRVPADDDLSVGRSQDAPGRSPQCEGEVRGQLLVGDPSDSIGSE